jgi:uncharacterized protein (UPF0371 family)
MDLFFPLRGVEPGMESSVEPGVEPGRLMSLQSHRRGLLCTITLSEYVMQQGFDNDRYLEEQTGAILERIGRFNNKLYLEFGGKLMFDYHASRVLPGFDPNVKIRLLERLKDKAEIIVCIYAGDIEKGKVRADFGLTYDDDTMKLIDDLRDRGLSVCGVVITRFTGQPAALRFKMKLERRNVRVYTHPPTLGYPADTDLIVSDAGYGANEYIETSQPLVVVTGPGPGSGKLATSLSQLYHDYRRGMRSGYAKFETFPIWNLPLKHPVNAAYEAATADLKDYNQVDPFHLEAYDVRTVNYNRDIEAFPLLRRILKKITGAESIYKSPTDMGVNRAGFGIVDDEAVRKAAKEEIIRRYFRYSCEYAMGLVEKDTVDRIRMVMEEASLNPENREVVLPAREAAERAESRGKGHDGVYCGAALKLPTGEIVTGSNAPILHSASSLILNSIKILAGIDDSVHLLSPEVIESIRTLKRDILNKKFISLDLEETLIALSISATRDEGARRAMEELKNLEGCEVHLTHIPTPGDEAGLKRLGINATSDPYFSSSSLFVG